MTMAGEFANIIIDISHEKVDRPFQYRIPEKLKSLVRSGTRVTIPFGAGNRERTGYVVEVTDRAEIDPDRIKEITGIIKDSVSAESQLIGLAWWMKETYGSTMNQALKTVLPVKQKTKAAEKKTIRCLLSLEELRAEKQEAERKHYKARARLLTALEGSMELPYGEYDGFHDFLEVRVRGKLPGDREKMRGKLRAAIKGLDGKEPVFAFVD